MKNGVSKIRNPVIARGFRELKLIEQWGSGVRNILHQSWEMGLPEPLVQEIGMRLRSPFFWPGRLLLINSRSVHGRGTKPGW